MGRGSGSMDWKSSYHGYSAEQFNAIADSYDRCPYGFKTRPNKSNSCIGCLRKNNGVCEGMTEGSKVTGPIPGNSLGSCLGVK